jgi:diguanylate cyclase (GGDEF)-like protein
LLKRRRYHKKLNLSPSGDETTSVTKRTRSLLVLGGAVAIAYWLVLLLITVSSLESADFGKAACVLALEAISLPLAGLLFRAMKRRIAADAAELAHRDALTGLPNRLHFSERLQAALVRSERNGKMVAVAFLDLDRFKLVNDTLGHGAGDKVLKEVSRRFRMHIRAGESLARLGGDEFTFLAEGLSSVDGAEAMAARLLATLESPLLVDGHEVATTCSIGVALNDRGSCSGDELLRRADIALYQAKADGRACYRVFSADTKSPSVERLDTDAGLKRALRKDELRLYFQPIISLKTGDTDCFEALVRWEHPARGLLLPGAFIPSAEEAGLIHALGRWVMREACFEAVEWQRRFPRDPARSVCVNVSPLEFRERGIVAEVEKILSQTGLDPNLLKLEFVETALIADADNTDTILQGFRDLGVKLSIDDFGTGYSSLSYLRRFEVDTLKIDRSFLSQATGDRRLRAIIRSIIALAHDLEIDVTAEGIETREQLAFLVGSGCDHGQGYLFARPLPREALYHFLQSQEPVEERTLVAA